MTIEEVEQIIKDEILNANVGEYEAQDRATREGCIGMRNAYKKCLSLIEQIKDDKEKPMKPIVEKTRPVVDATCYGYGYKDDICPHCHKLLNRWSLEWNRDKYDYCPHCGQKLDWEEEDKCSK